MPLNNSSRLRALCVSIHDVAPSTWPQCQRWLAAIRAVADIPVSLLVVPAYHRLVLSSTPEYERGLERRLALGDELILHGYTHLDQGPPARSWREHWVRTVYTHNEAEFLTLDEQDARQRLMHGMRWFEQRSWPLEGFVAPAWLLGAPAERVLRSTPFRYTTTRMHFHGLPHAQRLMAPALSYGVGTGLRSRCAVDANRILQLAQEHRPLLRLALHPPDVEQPHLVADAQKMIVRALKTRCAMTKGAFARSCWQSVTVPAVP